MTARKQQQSTQPELTVEEASLVLQDVRAVSTPPFDLMGSTDTARAAAREMRHSQEWVAPRQMGWDE